MQTALELSTLGYWQVMRSLRAPNTDLAFNVGRLHVMRSIKRLATEELHRLDRAFQQQIENEGSAA